MKENNLLFDLKGSETDTARILDLPGTWTTGSDARPLADFTFRV